MLMPEEMREFINETLTAEWSNEVKHHALFGKLLALAGDGERQAYVAVLVLELIKNHNAWH